MKYRAYTGIGSRETPPTILDLMSRIAKQLGRIGFTLRSGCAEGADSAFESGADDGRFPMELYIPWRGFGNREVVTLEAPQVEAYEITEKFHPAWSRLSLGAKKLHARNAHQILGRDITNPVLSELVICWTEGGSGKGGTGQALRMAKHYEIPIYDLGSNLADVNGLEELRDWYKKETK